MILKHLPALAGTIAVGVGLAACGDDGRNHEAFVDDVNRVCEAHIEQRGEIASVHFSDDQPPTAEQLQAFYADFAPVYAETADNLADIEADEDHADAYTEYIAAWRRNAETLSRAATDTELTQQLLDTDEAALHEGEELAGELGTNPEC